MSSLTQQKPLADKKDIVSKRFSLVTLDTPLNEMLYNVSLKLENERSEEDYFFKNLKISLPNAEEYLNDKINAPLSPLETVEERIQLPSLPAVLIRLQKELFSEKTSSSRIAEIIQLEPKLTSALLSLVNSSYYGLPTKIETITRAVTLLGNRQISALALATRMLSMFQDCPPEGLPAHIFWKHSLACAIIAKHLAQRCQRKEPEKYFIAGLLHDFGRLLLFSARPKQAKIVLALQIIKRVPLDKGEHNVFDLDHAMLGGMYLGKWNLPKSFVTSALYHHTPEKCLNKEVPEIVYAANQLATAIGISCNAYYTVPADDALIWNKLGLSLQEIESLLLCLDEELKASFASLMNNLG